LPLFIYDGADGKNYILAVRGNGLWDEIWGYIALENDLNTIAGATFDHKGETPGLGAEIKDNPQFAKNFIGKKIYDNSGKYVSVKVQKGGADPENMYAVDGISGATVTADGVGEMLARGIEYYDAYFDDYKATIDAGKKN
jgi:Na+-transporting NADH:ubiquinone oxidoreductase subunit C